MITIQPNSKPWQHLSSSTSSYQLFNISSETKKLSVQNLILNSISDQDNKKAKIKRLVLSQEGRTKLDIRPDKQFYDYPRFVTHVDDKFISTLTNVYRQKLRADTEIFDLMSSWISHLPGEVQYKRVVGHGLNAQELARNPRLDYFFVKDLNQDQDFELESCSFDAVLCTVSVQYLQQPEKVFTEVCRILRPGGVFIVSFSNRLFYEKAISAWREGTAYSRVQLVTQYFQCVEGFTQPEIIRKLPGTGDGVQDNKSPLSWIMGLLGFMSGSDPFYAVVAYKNFKPIYD
ncbi:S-adenosyl-L-methionine-dependent methyltransferases superfamily protein [Heracleum sosnowskyi]|uniref:S-adenosyl-L-methionine-dependent methyltransferases superfamily protein n=1 Tax=Heracleum sosnowskyi TaxID=360622 RepID=A0AAD8IDH8_9APIA|nr:S-adenosyl-L-methionine-dependent methyltransferases superfamily protein [Heracleum sosnowskyi]